MLKPGETFSILEETIQKSLFSESLIFDVFMTNNSKKRIFVHARALL